MSRVYKGNWNDAENYIIDDVVLYQYKFYLAISNNTNEEPINNDNWTRITAIDVLCYIIQTQLNIDNDRIFIYNQDFKFPNDKNLLIVVQYNSSLSYANIREVIAEEDNLKEKNTSLTIENMTINFISKNDDARLRKEEIFLALSSTFAEQQQEIYNIKIALLSNSFVNVSEAEGSGMLNRFAIDLNVSSWAIKEQNIEYYDNFSFNTINN